MFERSFCFLLRRDSRRDWIPPDSEHSLRSWVSASDFRLHARADVSDDGLRIARTLLREADEMKTLLLLLFFVGATTCGFAFSEGAMKTFFQYACFLSLVVSGGMLMTGATD